MAWGNEKDAEMSERIPSVPYLREQVKAARARSSEQPGVIRLSCFDAEALLAVVDAAREYAAFVLPASVKGRPIFQARERLQGALAGATSSPAGTAGPKGDE